MPLRIFALALLAAFAASAVAEQPDPRVAWLAAHAVRVRSIEPHDDDFTDLEPLRGNRAAGLPTPPAVPG
jgi:hypothetical protein